MISARRRLGVSDERGAVLALVAVGLFAMVIIVALVLNTAGWFVRHRHLQLQADAGAFAGAVAFNECTASATAGDPKIVGVAHQYAGDPGSIAPYTPVRNGQIATDANVIVRVNSQDYGASGVENSEVGPPCTAKWVDVKVTDSKLPWFFAPGIHLNTHARVSILQLSRLNEGLPLAVQDVNPRAVGAIFVNEDSVPGNAILARSLLTPGTTTQTLNGQPLLPWTGSAVSVSVAAASRHVGVVIALCSNKRICATSSTSGWLTTPGSINALCTQVFVTCDSSSQTGLDLIHGYDSSAGSTAAPGVKNVALTSTGCDDSAPYFFLNGDCTIGGTVDVDFGLTTNPTRSPTATPAGVSAAVTLECNGGNSICPNNKKSCSMTYQSTTGTISHWNASNCIKINSGAGQAKLDVKVVWTTRAGTVNTNHTLAAPDARVTNVARPFANDGVNGAFFASTAGSYPIAYTQVWQNSSCTGSGAHSVPFGTTSFCVGIGIAGNIKNAADFNDQTRVLKFFQTGSTGAVDCGNGNLENQIEIGCDLTTQLNTGEACPNTTIPVDCLDTYQGKATGQVKHGMDKRFGCTANNWTAANIPAGGTLPAIPSGDPRAVPLLVTLYGSFETSGKHSIPITDYAEFYVTGWSGSSCASNQAAPPGADSQSSIWGHFIKYIGTFATSSGGAACDFTALAPCVTVMTR